MISILDFVKKKFVLVIEGKLSKCTVMSEPHYSKQTSKQLTTKSNSRFLSK